MYALRDLRLDDDGDLQLAPGGDLQLSTPSQSLSQEVLFRLRTNHGDYGPDPFLGADLGSLLGQPLHQRTVDLAIEHASIALTRKSFLPRGVLFIDAVPLSKTKLALLVLVNVSVEGLSQPLVTSFTLDLEGTGLSSEESLTNTDVL